VRLSVSLDRGDELLEPTTGRHVLRVRRGDPSFERPERRLARVHLTEDRASVAHDTAVVHVVANTVVSRVVLARRRHRVWVRSLEREVEEGGRSERLREIDDPVTALPVGAHQRRRASSGTRLVDRAMGDDDQLALEPGEDHSKRARHGHDRHAGVGTKAKLCGTVQLEIREAIAIDVQASVEHVDVDAPDLSDVVVAPGAEPQREDDHPERETARDPSDATPKPDEDHRADAAEGQAHPGVQAGAQDLERIVRVHAGSLRAPTSAVHVHRRRSRLERGA